MDEPFIALDRAARDNNPNLFIAKTKPILAKRNILDVHTIKMSGFVGH